MVNPVIPHHVVAVLIVVMEFIKLRSQYENTWSWYIVPSKRDTMLRANATVIHLGRMDMVRLGSNPIRRPTRAVEYKENMVEAITDVNISAACLLTSCPHMTNTI